MHVHFNHEAVSRTFSDTSLRHLYGTQPTKTVASTPSLSRSDSPFTRLHAAQKPKSADPLQIRTLECY